jgi:hypothetical protein
MAKHWIQGSIKRPGALTRKAKAANMTVAAYVAHPPKNITMRTRHQIAEAKTLASLRQHRRGS